jgi:hypothetical protein
MGINSIGKFFMPKNVVFYELFEDVAKKVHEMGIKLKELVSETLLLHLIVKTFTI